MEEYSKQANENTEAYLKEYKSAITAANTDNPYSTVPN